MAKGAQPDIEKSAGSIVEISNHVYEVVRSMMQRLRPGALDALGLRDAVADLVDQWRDRNPRVMCGFEADSDLSGLGELTNITVYRLVQDSGFAVQRPAAAHACWTSAICEGLGAHP